METITLTKKALYLLEKIYLDNLEPVLIEKFEESIEIVNFLGALSGYFGKLETDKLELIINEDKKQTEPAYTIKSNIISKCPVKSCEYNDPDEFEGCSDHGMIWNGNTCIVYYEYMNKLKKESDKNDIKQLIKKREKYVL